MATLTGKTVKSTYKDLMQVSNGNSGIDATLRDVEDGEGTASAMQLSTGAMSVDNIKIDGNTISSIDTNGDVDLAPNGSGTITATLLNYTLTLGSSAPSANNVFLVDGSGNITFGAIDLTTDITGVLPVANGGSGQSTYTDGQLLIGNTTGNTLSKAALTGGTNLTVTNGSGTITLDVDDSFLSNQGDIGTGVYDFGGADSLEIPNGATPALAAAGQVAIDTTITDHTGMIKYHDGTEELVGIAMPTANLIATDGYVVTYNATNDEFEMTAKTSDTDTNSIKEVVYLPGSFESNNANPASLEFLNGTNVDTMVRAFDDTTVEYVEGKFLVPTDIDTAATVTFRTYSMAKTAAASKNVEYTLEHLALNGGEDFDPTTPYTSEVSGDLTVDSTQDNIQEDTWTETVANLGWAANDVVLFRLSRTDPSANDLVGDLYLFSLAIEMPRA